MILKSLDGVFLNILSVKILNTTLFALNYNLAGSVNCLRDYMFTPTNDWTMRNCRMNIVLCYVVRKRIVSRLGRVFFFFFPTFRSCTLNRWNLLFALFTTTTPPCTFSSSIHPFVTGPSVPAINCFALFAPDLLLHWWWISIVGHVYIHMGRKYRLWVMYIYIGGKYRLCFSVFRYPICFCRKTIPSFSLHNTVVASHESRYRLRWYILK